MKIFQRNIENTSIGICKRGMISSNRLCVDYLYKKVKEKETGAVGKPTAPVILFPQSDNRRRHGNIMCAGRSGRRL